MPAFIATALASDTKIPPNAGHLPQKSRVRSVSTWQLLPLVVPCRSKGGVTARLLTEEEPESSILLLQDDSTKLGFYAGPRVHKRAIEAARTRLQRHLQPGQHRGRKCDQIVEAERGGLLHRCAKIARAEVQNCIVRDRRNFECRLPTGRRRVSRTNRSGRDRERLTAD